MNNFDNLEKRKEKYRDLISLSNNLNLISQSWVQDPDRIAEKGALRKKKKNPLYIWNK